MRARSGGAAAGFLLAAAAGLYVVAAWQSAPGFYDGFAPPADTYRWVKAPDGVTTSGLKPLPGAASLVVSTDQTDPELLAWLGELGAHKVTGKPLDLALLVVRGLERRTAGAA